MHRCWVSAIPVLHNTSCHLHCRQTSHNIFFLVTFHEGHRRSRCLNLDQMQCSHNTECQRLIPYPVYPGSNLHNMFFPFGYMQCFHSMTYYVGHPRHPEESRCSKSSKLNHKQWYCNILHLEQYFAVLLHSKSVFLCCMSMYRNILHFLE